MASITKPTSQTTPPAQTWSSWAFQKGREWGSEYARALSFTYSVGSIVVGVATANPFIGGAGVVGVADQVFRTKDSKEQALASRELRKSSRDFAYLVQKQKSQIKEKDRAIQEQKSEIDRLFAINTELAEKNEQLNQLTQSFDELNREHIQILEKQKKTIEENRGLLSSLRGTVQGYEVRKEALLTEITENQEIRRQIRGEIQSLLAQQRILLANQSQAQKNYDTLQSAHNELQDQYTSLQTNHRELLVKHRRLNTELAKKVDLLKGKKATSPSLKV